MKRAQITNTISEKDIERNWLLFDAKGKILGRMATKIAEVLIGKNKTWYSPNHDGGDNVIVINASKIKVTGKKMLQKEYTRYSGYPSGLSRISFVDMRNKNPKEIIRRAVWGMIPKNKLRKNRITRLHIFPDEHHPFLKKLQEEVKK